MYSRSRCTNWARFHPSCLEIEQLPESMIPSAAIDLPGDQEPIQIIERPVHRDFIQPCNPSQVTRVLDIVPREFLAGLRRVCILGGTKKQLRARRAFFFGHYYYYDRAIYLHAFPRSQLSMPISRRPKPSVEREYTRAGAEVTRSPSGWRIEFTLESLRRFYLFDVLLHEVGHHVDRATRKNYAASERYAHWFVEQRGHFPDVDVE